MRIRSGRRRFVKWGVTGALGMVLAGWGLSGWRAFGWLGPRAGVVAQVGAGGMGLTLRENWTTSGSGRWFWQRVDPSWEAWSGGRPSWQRTGPVQAIWVPFWLLTVVGGVGCGRLWWRDRGFPAGYCGVCGYDLRGTPSGVCPECGEKNVVEV